MRRRSALGAVVFVVVSASCSAHRSTGDPNAPTLASRRMLDGKQWMTENLNVPTPQSYCYDDADSNCRGYGRLYTWESAQRACESLRNGWRLPTNAEWQAMAKHYGGIRDDSTDGGMAAYAALTPGGSSGFNAVLGGGRSPDGQYARLAAHGFYWTASATGPRSAWFYNFGQGSRFLNRHDDGETSRALSVRCVRDADGVTGAVARRGENSAVR